MYTQSIHFIKCYKKEKKMIRILTDSGSGLEPKDAKKHNFEMVHMPINFEDSSYWDGLDITSEEFYKKLKASKTLPKTAAVNSHTFEEVFKDVKEKGDEMIVFCMSKELSITHQQAVLAKETVGYDKIYIIDTLGVADMLVAQVMEAVKMRKQGLTAKAIVAEVEKLVPKTRLFAYVDTLKYLRAGGRVSATKAIIGTLLGIKPNLIVVDGKLDSTAKFAGVRKAQEYLVNRLSQPDVDLSRPIYFAHTDAKAECEKVREQIAKNIKFKDGGIYNISATIGTHAGPGAVAIAFFEK